MFEVGALCRAFLFAACTVEVNGLEGFTKLLDSRREPSKRTRGLVTGILFSVSCGMKHSGSINVLTVLFFVVVANHISVYVCTVW